MSFIEKYAQEMMPFELLQEQEVCFECGGKLATSAVRYDGHTNQHRLKSILLHPGCAALMGQRLITDGYPNRQKS